MHYIIFTLIRNLEQMTEVYLFIYSSVYILKICKKRYQDIVNSYMLFLYSFKFHNNLFIYGMFLHYIKTWN